jgi:hypothetical protein
LLRSIKEKILKILLLGEFSGLHKNLQTGLRKIGHDTDLASAGDGFKQIFGDLLIPSIRNRDLFSKIYSRKQLYNFLYELSGYDVIQIINPSIFPHKFFPYERLVKRLKEKNKKVFLLAAGCDAYFWQVARHKMKYGPFKESLKYDSKSESNLFLSNQYLDFNRFIAESVDGIIPIMYEYAIGYDGFVNVRSPIPLPIDLGEIRSQPNVVCGRLRVIHGHTRFGFKGTFHISKAFCSINKRYSSEIQAEILSPVRLLDYAKIVQSANVIVDQVNSYSYGMNALLGAAHEKIVISGNERECADCFGLPSSPILNGLPDSSQIATQIINLSKNPELIRQISRNSRLYVEQFHSAEKVAKLYVEEWCR